MRKCWLLAVIAVSAIAQDFPKGEVIPSVPCAADPSQTYALYLPSNYTPAKQWNVIFAFDPGGRGLQPVERYKEAAEKYGYIVAGSLNSRNGSWSVIEYAARAMTSDVRKRFSINSARMYTAGQSGGARAAMYVALDMLPIAGVLASSAGFPDSTPHPTLKFVVFGSAGTEDFNYREMRQLDRDIKSTHRVEIFQGGHTWLPADMAMRAVEWMELQAMKSGLHPRDEAFIKRVQEEMSRQQKLQAAFIAPPATEQLEAKMSEEMESLEEGLTADVPVRDKSFAKIRDMLTKLAADSKGPNDTVERRMARRLLAGVLAESRGIDHAEYQALIRTLRPTSRVP